MTLSVAAYLVWFLVLIVAVASVVRGGRLLALIGAIMAWGLVGATIRIEERLDPATSWRSLGLMLLGVAGLLAFLVSVLRGKVRPRR